MMNKKSAGMRRLKWLKWLATFWSLCLTAYFIMWMVYLSDKFGPFARFWNPLPEGMGYEAQNAVTWMFVSALFPNVFLAIIPYWAATLGFWLRKKWSLIALPLATGGWCYSSLNNWMCKISLGSEHIFSGIADEILVSYLVPVLLIALAVPYFKSDYEIVFK